MKLAVYAKTEDGKIITQTVSEKAFNNLSALPNETRVQRLQSYTDAVAKNLIRQTTLTPERDKKIFDKQFASVTCKACADVRFVTVDIWCGGYQANVPCAFACKCNDKPPKTWSSNYKEYYSKAIDLVAAGVYKFHCQLSVDCYFAKDERAAKCGNVACPRFDNGFFEYNKNANDLKQQGVVNDWRQSNEAV